MIQATPKLSTVNEFIAQHSDQEQYELIDGELVDLEPTGLHEQVIDFLARNKWNIFISRSGQGNNERFMRSRVK